jgi:hypothetical protein
MDGLKLRMSNLFEGSKTLGGFEKFIVEQNVYEGFLLKYL